MNVLLYSTTRNGAGERLENMIEVLEEPVEVFRTVDSFSRRLRQPGKDWSIAVLVAASRKDMWDLVSISDLLEGLRIILILPDSHKDTITKGHRLRPRFLTYADSDLTQVGAVLEKMLKIAAQEIS